MGASVRRRGRGHRLAVHLTLGVLVAAGLTVSTVGSTPTARAADESIAVDFSVATGSPTYRASGWIYGMTENGSAPPDNYFRDVKFQYMRAGGAQLPGSGWVGGSYDRRWNSTLAQARRTIALGGQFILLPHDLWGADGAAISRFPGDNGNWTDYDNFLNRVMNDVRASGITVQWDIWNEPNITLFWNRPISQYLELWRRTYQRLRTAFPNHLIVGPSCACVPSTSHTFWNQYLDFVKANNVVPDIISWHSLPGDPVANVAAANTTLNSRGIPHPRPYQINEYASTTEQNPGDGSWYIARLERAGADGLRANWAGGGNLHNDLANLLTRNSAGQYSPKGEWWVYRFYGSQTGTIATTTPSGSYDAFATRDSGTAKILVGGGGTTGNIAVNLRRVDATSGVVHNNQVRVVAQRIPYNGGGAVQGPVTIQDSVVTLASNGTTVNLPHTNADDSFTITLLPPPGGPSPTATPTPTSPTPTPPTPTPPTPTPPTPTTPPAQAGCTASASLNSWPGGFVASVRVTAGSTALRGWRVTAALPAGGAVTNTWSANASGTSGTVQFTNVDYNGNVAAGQSTEFGFQGSGSATGMTVSCTGS